MLFGEEIDLFTTHSETNEPLTHEQKATIQSIAEQYKVAFYYFDDPFADIYIVNTNGECLYLELDDRNDTVYFTDYLLDIEKLKFEGSWQEFVDFIFDSFDENYKIGKYTHEQTQSTKQPIDNAIFENINSFMTEEGTETAEQAIKRLNDCLAYINNEECLRDYVTDEVINEYHEPVTLRTVTHEQLKAEEQRLGIELPKPYKDFVISNGLIKIGKEYDNNREMFLPIQPMTDALIEWGSYDSVAQMHEQFFDNNAEHIEKISNMYVFSWGDEGYQAQFFHYFDYNEESEDGIPVRSFCQDDLETITGDYTDFESFDEYMSWAVNNQIEDIIEEIEEYCE